MRLQFLLAGCFALAACATSTPAPREYVYYEPVEYGPPGDPANPMQGPFQPNAELFVCSGRISNAPPFEGDGRISVFNPIIVVNNQIVMSSVPSNDVCLTSGYGRRRSRLHKGSDYAPRPHGGSRWVYSAAPGIVREAKLSNGYGYQVLLDHGYGVYTRYAHLQSFEPWVQVGAEIGFGHVIGQMGKSGNADGVHLHFEILTGNLNNPKGSFGLTPNDPLAYPAWAGLDQGY